MKSKIYIHKYKIYSRQGLNSRSHSIEHEGALIRVEVDSVSGYGCLHPWEELGDLSLNELLDQLSTGRSSRQVKCVLECARIDREARSQNINLFEGLEVPMSHATIVGGIDKVGLAVEAGFDTVKIKMGRNGESNSQLMRNICESFPELRIRIDFNGVAGMSGIEKLLMDSGEEGRRQIDFIEDPLPVGHAGWEVLREKYGVKFAVDRGVSEASWKYDLSVIKPAINNMEKIATAAQMAGRNVVITSYMDHPLGQCYAAYCAGKMNEKYLGLVDKRCGLMTHGLFEPDAFIEDLGKVTPLWNNKCKHGASFQSNLRLSLGLGFDDLLDGLNWRRVK